MSAGATIATLKDGMLTAYEPAPALAVVVAAALLAVPLAAIGAVVRLLFVARSRARAGQVADGRLPVCDSDERTGFAPPRRAWLEMDVDGTVSRFRISSDLTRIGREPDNDIRLAGTGTHRYHAAISRTAELDHYAVVLTGDEARDMRVNGAPVARRRLRNGDVITLGGTTLTFRAEGYSE